MNVAAGPDRQPARPRRLELHRRRRLRLVAGRGRSLGAASWRRARATWSIVGGVDAIQTPFAYLCFTKTQALSPSGRCRPFDAEADGIAISEGFAAVVLKRLADAERDGDRIYAVIRGVGAGSATGATGASPRRGPRARCARSSAPTRRPASRRATVGLVEAHGTGTVAGDGAEVQALSRVFARGRRGAELDARSAR